MVIRNRCQGGTIFSGWSTNHTIGVVLVVGLVFGLGVVSVSVTFDEGSNWGVWAFAILAVLLIALLVVIGDGVVGKVWGALIDRAFRVSLAEFQLAVWTVVVLAAWAAAVFVNLGLNAGADAFDVSIPSELWLALGISVTSFGGAKLAQGLQVRDARKAAARPNATVAPNERPLPSPPAGETVDVDEWTVRRDVLQPDEGPKWVLRDGLLGHTKPGEARFGDMFVADDVVRPEIAKIQMFFFTIVLAFGYAVACIGLFATEGSTAITALPALNESFAILLGISQGGYLLKKGLNAAS